MPELAELQGWLQARITGGLWAPDATEGVEERVAGAYGLTPQDRVAIYARSYVARLAECLSAEFPVLKALIGDQVFNLFAGGYLSAHPPTSYSLYDLGAGFADYLEATRPGVKGPDAALALLPPSLARLERAISESSRAEGVEGRALSVAPDLVGWLAGTGAGPRVPDTVRLLRLPFDFSPTLAAVRAGERPVAPAQHDTLLAVARSRYVVRTHVLEPWAFVWLETLARGGAAQAAVEAAAQASASTVSQVLAKLTVWQSVAFEVGLATDFAKQSPLP